MTHTKASSSARQTIQFFAKGWPLRINQNSCNSFDHRLRQRISKAPKPICHPNLEPHLIDPLQQRIGFLDGRRLSLTLKQTASFSDRDRRKRSFVNSFQSASSYSQFCSPNDVVTYVAGSCGEAAHASALFNRNDLKLAALTQFCSFLSLGF